MSNFLTVEDQIALFRELRFDSMKLRAVLPNGQLIDKKRFNVLFGGRIFAMDKDNIRTTRHAWTAYTSNEAYRPTFL